MPILDEDTEFQVFLSVEEITCSRSAFRNYIQEASIFLKLTDVF